MVIIKDSDLNQAGFFWKSASATDLPIGPVNKLHFMVIDFFGCKQRQRSLTHMVVVRIEGIYSS